MTGLVEEIVRSGLCIGCGLCESLAGADRIEMTMTAAGRERPVVHGPVGAAAEHAIAASCPGLVVRGAERRRLAPGVAVDRVWGPIARVARCHASDPALRFAGASGGVLSALASWLLESGRVSMVVHVAASRSAPMRSEGWISFDRTAVLQAAGSRYGPAAPLRDFGGLLAGGRPFALIGKPCDVAAVRNLARLDRRVDELMRYALAFVCGGASTLGPSRDVLAGFGVAEAELRRFSYRGRGNPGATTFETVDGRRHSLSYEEMWGGDEASWQLQSRCKICPDAIGEAADLVAADCWPGGTPPPGGDDGFNAVMVRTRAGHELFDAAVGAGVLTVAGALGPRDLDDCNPHQVAKKEAVFARLAGVRAAGGRVPRVRGLRIARLALRRPPRELAAEFRGAGRRFRSGRFGEPRAQP